MPPIFHFNSNENVARRESLPRGGPPNLLFFNITQFPFSPRTSPPPLAIQNIFISFLFTHAYTDEAGPACTVSFPLWHPTLWELGWKLPASYISYLKGKKLLIKWRIHGAKQGRKRWKYSNSLSIFLECWIAWGCFDVFFYLRIWGKCV